MGVLKGGMRLVKEELGDGSVGMGMSGAEQEEDGEDTELLAGLPRMSSM